MKSSSSRVCETKIDLTLQGYRKRRRNKIAHRKETVLNARVVEIGRRSNGIGDVRFWGDHHTRSGKPQGRKKRDRPKPYASYVRNVTPSVLSERGRKGANVSASIMIPTGRRDAQTSLAAGGRVCLVVFRTVERRTFSGAPTTVHRSVLHRREICSRVYCVPRRGPPSQEKDRDSSLTRRSSDERSHTCTNEREKPEPSYARTIRARSFSRSRQWPTNVRETSNSRNGGCILRLLYCLALRSWLRDTDGKSPSRKWSHSHFIL